MKDEKELSIGNRWLEVGKVAIFLTEQRYESPKVQETAKKVESCEVERGRSADGDLVKNRAWNTL